MLGGLYSCVYNWKFIVWLYGCGSCVTYELGRLTPMLHTSQIQFLCPYISVQIGAMSKPMWI